MLLSVTLNQGPFLKTLYSLHSGSFSTVSDPSFFRLANPDWFQGILYGEASVSSNAILKYFGNLVTRNLVNSIHIRNKQYILTTEQPKIRVLTNKILVWLSICWQTNIEILGIVFIITENEICFWLRCYMSNQNAHSQRRHSNVNSVAWVDFSSGSKRFQYTCEI